MWLKEIVPEYNPSPHVLRRALVERQTMSGRRVQAKEDAHLSPLRRLLNAELLLRAFRDKLAAALTPDECWEVLQRAYSEFGFNEIRFKMGDRVYRHTTNGDAVRKLWTVRIQLSKTDYLNLSREPKTQVPPIVARFSDTIGEILATKMSSEFLAEPMRRHIPITGFRGADSPVGRLKAS